MLFSLPDVYGSEKNEATWAWLNQRLRISIAAINNRFTFNGCYPTTAIVRLTMRSRVARVSLAKDTVDTDLSLPIIKLVRGTIPMYQYKAEMTGGRIPFVHTTELRNNTVDINARFINSVRACVKGNFVLLPRVGQPSVDKLACLSTESATFSDCILGIECGGWGHAEELYSVMRGNWSDIERMYQGTGAPYITVRRSHSCCANLDTQFIRITTAPPPVSSRRRYPGTQQSAPFCSMVRPREIRNNA